MNAGMNIGMNAEMNIELSIIIPTFRRKESLYRLLDRLVVQQDVRAEILVVDQNPAGYLEDLERFGRDVKQVMLAEPNASQARNVGFLASRGGIVLFVDDDLVPEPDF